jgi:hypothetical protein
MVVQQRGEPFDVLGIDRQTVSPKVVQREAHVTGVPHHDCIQDQTERTELILLTFAIRLRN